MKKQFRIALLFSLILLLIGFQTLAKSPRKPIRLAVAGMTHGHIPLILGRADKGDFELVGVYEPNQELVHKLAQRYNFPESLSYKNLGEMLDKVKPDAVVAFGSNFDHLAVVEACAPRGIHVMVEKPLAVNMKHAERMAGLARKYKIHLLTDYETSWYPSSAQSFKMVNEGKFVGTLRKVVIHDGHQGPKEIGCDPVFLEWLTDPILNGGGAIVDFGCYGANLMTALTMGEKPVSVTAVIRRFKPDVYPKVDDEATIVVSYPGSQCIIQASWNWPFSRKDMEIYGDKGYIVAVNGKEMRIRGKDMAEEKSLTVSGSDVAVYEDPFCYFADVIRGKITEPEYGTYSLENNLLVVKILDAARASAKSGKRVSIK
ncbi:MAG: Gfo/Idh/MocA family oxidoreductase [Prolixibacteraceae bacterium]|jgi:predicted dehydrogenase|nr:Gfo/Idh/MocA family oxidoreductase [Prolixibacteraceae bacterium]